MSDSYWTFIDQRMIPEMGHEKKDLTQEQEDPKPLTDEEFKEMLLTVPEMALEAARPLCIIQAAALLIACGL